jgi:hypothetical protein
MSNPIAATAGSRLAAVAKVPGRHWPDMSWTAPSERGKNSYQLENDPCSRSTQTSKASERVSRSRTGSWSSSPVTAGDSASSSRSSTVPSGERSPRAAAASCRAAGAGIALRARSSSWAPSSSSREMSCPAPSLTSTLCRQVANGSAQASITKLHRPGSVKVTGTCQRARPWLISTSRSAGIAWPRGLVSTTSALTASWPSRNTVAATVRVSPVMARDGHRPPATEGVTSVMGMRPIFIKRDPTLVLADRNVLATRFRRAPPYGSSQRRDSS